MTLQGKKALIIGGSRGLGLGLVEAMLAAGATVTATARTAADLDKVAARLGIETVIADATDATAMRPVLAKIQPDIVVMNAGLPPPMHRIDQVTWDDFSANWNADAKAGLTVVQAALTQPLAPGSLVVLVSSGAAVMGSPLSGGYAGAKRALWFMAQYAQGLSDAQGMGLRFRVLVPRQMVAGTGTGDAGISGYAAASGVSYAEKAATWPVTTPRALGDMVTEAIGRTMLDEGRVFGLRADTGMTMLE